jgi:D-glutamate N-acetyltransferase
VMPERVPERRYAILAEGWFVNRHAKTAHGLIRYGKDEVVAVIDSTLAGRSVRAVMPELGRDAPIVGSLREVLELSPTSILVGLAPAGGRLPEEWMDTLGAAAEAGLEIVSGLHQRLGPKFPGERVWDVREPPEDIPLFSGEALEVGPKVALTVGTDTAIGKMTATLEIERSAKRAGMEAEFVATGQTGIIIAGRGICVDAVISDFVAGASEQLVLEAARRGPDLILVEGQGSLGHPAYSGVTLGLLHGSCPDCLILCAADPHEEVFTGVPRPSPAHVARLYEEVAALVKPAPVVAVSVNTGGLAESEAREFVARVTDETGVPAADPFRASAAPILEAVVRAPKTRAARTRSWRPSPEG